MTQINRRVNKFGNDKNKMEITLFSRIVFKFAISICLLSFANGYANLKFKKGSPIISTTNGFLEGSVNSTRDGRFYFAFRGIPYSEEVERFKESKPIGKWDGLKNAREFGPACPQISKQTGDVIGSENCLFLNVYFPKGLEETLVPVILYIDGKDFLTGGGHTVNPEHFLDENIVFVTVSYRIGVLGYLNTEDSLVTGNAGMKDLILSLKWIQKEIQFFGGDPNKVTLFGGENVHFLILSPLAKGLFQNAISIDRNALNPSAFQSNPLEAAKHLGQKLNCPENPDTKTLLKCLESQNLEELVKAQHNHWSSGPVYRFTPSVDKNALEQFLPDTPYNLIVKGNHAYVPWIIGGSDDSGLEEANEIMGDEVSLKALEENWNAVAPDFLEYRKSVEIGNLDAVSQEIWKYYFNNSSKIDSKNLRNLISDRRYWLGIKTSAFYYSKSAKAYACVFGTADGDLNDLLFGPQLKGQNVNVKFSKELVRLFTSFAETGKPKTVTQSSDLEWRPVPPSKIEIIAPIKWYRISKQPKIVADESDRLYFWHTLPLNEFKFQENVPIKDEF